MVQIKGYVQYFDERIPITWERETKNFVHQVKRIRMKNNQLIVDARLFDDKVNKDEIWLEASFHVSKTS